jgi:secreted trypsin-like serine protease
MGLLGSTSLIFLCFGVLKCSLINAEDQSTSSPAVTEEVTLVWPHPRAIVKIINGVSTTIGEFPFMAMLTDTSGTQFCGAALISHLHVITAAHCMYAGINLEEYIVRLGDYDKTTALEVRHIERSVTTAWVHPEYNEVSISNDLAILELDEEVSFTGPTAISRACMPNVGETYEGVTLNATGWGVTNTATLVTSAVLMRTSTPVVTNQVCDTFYSSSVPITDGMICTYDVGSDTCQGDSGGPLHVLNSTTGVFQLIGLVSFGMDCNSGYPAVNTRITYYLDYITNIVGAANLC